MPVEGLNEVQTPHTLSVEQILTVSGELVKENEILVKGKFTEDGLEYFVKAPCTGRVTNVYVKEGAIVRQGEKLVRIEPSDEKGKTALCAIMYLPVSEGVKLSGGEDAFVSPAGISLERYGYICGRVESVSRYPELFEGQQMIAVRVYLSTDSRSGRLDYTYHRIPQESPHGGSPCSGYILLGHVKPVEIIFPWLVTKD